ncbi:malectin domain-containing carbohydrate-binding protein [Novosphingobium sp. 2638]|uniref:Malectin domain-containing carbohydrate-binding protein n=1 Tax=Novosphingobium beihaiensis TaxID=2930389 RepID=A0ABT0BLG7_9SPHN|nr:malectin domain-containing carbohydrate-binding protein [Novosphingobium beihaiensis]
MGGGVVAAVAAPAAQAEAAPRQAVELADGWRFRFGDESGAVTGPGFDDSGWDQVSVPHTWNRIGGYGLERGPETNNKQGIGWYRLMVDAPAAAAGMRQYLDFAAVAKIADVWVNGQHVGTHKGGFARFRFDVTDVWKPGQPNLIVVKADNSKPEPDNASGQVLPLSGDFFVEGGIYRPVHLLQLPAASIDPLDYGGPGVYVRAAEITDAQAVVDVRTRLRNQGAARDLKLTTQIADASGKVVAQAVQPVHLAPGAAEMAARLTVPHPHRWNGRADPYLYSVTATLSGDGKVLDQVTQPLGLRTFRFDADAGFFLNGRHVKLHGVSRHQDWLGSGWALTDAQHERDMELIEELGANTVRQAHYQHADKWTELADKAGMVVWAELPYVTTPSLSGGKGSDSLWANADQQLREQIRQNYNHPSIMMWSVGNEVNAARGFGVKGKLPQSLPLLQHLNATAKQEDPDRPTAFADCCEGVGMMKTSGEKLAGTTDLIGYNRYYGWYYPKPLEVRAQLGVMLDKMHGAHPDIPISITEYGAGGAVTQHSDDVKSGFVNFVGRPHPEEYEAWLHEQSWPVINARDFVFASWVWNMFDFASDLRDEGDSVDLNDKGLVTADRKVKKDAFWYYKVAWSDAPAVHFAGKHYVDRSYPVMTVKAYANSPKARLTMGSKVVGEADCTDDVCEWRDVPLAPGPNKAVVTTVGGKESLTDTATWNGPDPQKGIRIDVGSLGTRDLDGHRYGSDTFVTGGTPTVLNLVGFGGRSLRPHRDVETANPQLFEYWREGESFSYGIPVPDGNWTVTLHMFEPDPKASDQQALTVTANGTPVIEGLNVQKAAGGPLKEVVRSFPVTVSGGVLKLDFASVGGKASLAAIEVTK